MLPARFSGTHRSAGSAAQHPCSRTIPLHPNSTRPACCLPSCSTSSSRPSQPLQQQRQQQHQHWRRSRSSVEASGQASSTLHLPLDRDLEDPLPGFDRIADALADLAAGKFLVVLDDESRENEGDLIIAADKVTTEAMAFMVEYTSGVVCIGMEGHDLDRLRLPLMVSSAENEDTMYTAFTITVDLRDGITTGISAADRANTIRKLADPAALPSQFRRPGHIFPLRARQGGVLVRPGHTEASVDLARLAGSFPAGALCEIVNKPDGSMSRTPELLAFSRQHGLKCIAIADLMRYRLRHERLVVRTSSATLSTRHGTLQAHTFKSLLDGAEHVALVAGGSVAGKPDVPVHVHAQNSVADLLGTAPASPSGSAIPADQVLQRMAAQGCGVLVYMQRPGTAAAVGVVNTVAPSIAEEVQRLVAVQGQQAQAAAVEARKLDLVDYGLAAQILKDLEVSSVRLASGNVEQHMALQSCGLKVSNVAWGADAVASNGHVAAGSSNGRILAGRS